MLESEKLETSYVYQNDRSMRVILFSIITPMIPLFIYLIFLYLFNFDRFFILFAILYLCLWLGLFMLVMMNVYEVMVVYKDRIVFINPYKQKVFPLASIKMIYYNASRGISFTMEDDKIIKMGFKFNYDKRFIEELFRRLTGFIGFSEEHIHDSNVYCLVNK